MLKVKKKKRKRRELSFTQSVDAAMFFAYSVKQKQEKGVFLFCIARRGELKKAMRFSFFFFQLHQTVYRAHKYTHAFVLFIFFSSFFLSSTSLRDPLEKEKAHHHSLFFCV